MKTSDENVSESRSEDQAATTCMSDIPASAGELVYLINEVLFQSVGYRIIDVDILGNIVKSMPCRVCLECQWELFWRWYQDDTKLCVFFLTAACEDTLKSSILQKNLVIVLK